MTSTHRTLHTTAGGRAFATALTALALSLCLCACAKSSPDAPFITYLERVGRTLDVMVAAPRATALAKPPRSAQLQLPLTGDTLNTLDFLALSGCALQTTIGKRNSSLGRMAKPSQRLLLELEFLRRVPQCIDHLRDEGRAALADQLAGARQMKQQQLPTLIFNATLGSDEYRAFWRTTRPAGEYPRVADQLAITALNAINQRVERWLSGDYSADNTAFEIALGEVAGGDGGAVLRSLVRQADWLAAANGMLQQRMDKGPLCGPALRHDAADILPNVVQKYFIEGIQPHAAELSRRYYRLTPAVNTLEQLLQETIPPAYRAWQQKRKEQLTAAMAAPREHVEQIQAIQAPCKQNPGR